MLQKLFILLLIQLLIGCAARLDHDRPPIGEEPSDEYFPDDPDKPIFIGDPPIPTLNYFTGGTWNVRQATRNTLTDETHVLPVGGDDTPNKNNAIFGLLDKFSVEIAAIQEIHHQSGAFPLVGQNDFKVIEGGVIVENANLGPEYCPVVYKEAIFDCTDHGTGWESGGRKIHWIKCTFDTEKHKPLPQRRKFYYGCGHYADDSSSSRLANIKGFFRYLDSDPSYIKPPRQKDPKQPRLKKGSRPDAFIIGADVNSYYHGANKTTWRRAKLDWFERNKRADGTVRQDIAFKESTPNKDNGGFSKIKNDGTAPGRRKIIDDLWWSLNQGINYVGPKNIADVLSLRDTNRYPNKHATEEKFLRTHWKLADHKLVYAEFSY